MAPLVSLALSVVGAVAVAMLFFFGGNALVDRLPTNWWAFTGTIGALSGLLVGAVAQHNNVLPSGARSIIGGFLVLGTLCGVAGTVWMPSSAWRGRLADRLRPVIFVGPILFFVTAGLVVPAIRTMVLSFRSGRSGEGGWSLDNYEKIFVERIGGKNQFIDFSRIGDVFTSRLMTLGLGALVFAGMVALASGAASFKTGPQRTIAMTTKRLLKVIALAVVGVLAVGSAESIARDPNGSRVLDFVVAVVAHRATLLLVVVLALATVVLVLASRRNESSYFEWDSPVPTSLVVLGVVLVLFAFLSTLEGIIWTNLWWVTTVAGLSTIFGLGLAVLADMAKAERLAKALIFMPMAISMVGAAVIWDFVYEVQSTETQTGLINAIIDALGFTPRGFFINASLIPWNNFFLMIIMIWIQTGFAMVILSAAIKGVAQELLDAARVDGATDAQVFWRVVIPQIRSTIVVVLTTLTMVVMKVFDLVRATTEGANRTNVLANAMFDALRARNFTLSSAIAVILFAFVLPVLIINVRRNRNQVAV